MNFLAATLHIPCQLNFAAPYHRTIRTYKLHSSAARYYCVCLMKKLYQKSYKTALLHLIAHSRAKVKTLSVSNSLVALLDGNNFLDNKMYSKQSLLGFVSKVGDDDEEVPNNRHHCRLVIFSLLSSSGSFVIFFPRVVTSFSVAILLLSRRR